MSISPGPDAFQNGGANPPAAEGEFPWEMIGLGLDEPLPPQDVMDDLYAARPHMNMNEYR